MGELPIYPNLFGCVDRLAHVRVLPSDCERHFYICLPKYSRFEIGPQGWFWQNGLANVARIYVSWKQHDIELFEYVLVCEDDSGA